MPNLPGRYAYSMEHQRERPVMAPPAASTTEYWPCPGCSVRVPEGQQCYPCACAEVEEWKQKRGKRR